jgi:hypothetical protein
MDGITLQEMSDETVQQLQANYVRQPAFAHTAGNMWEYTVTLDPAPVSINEGFGITIVPHVSNVFKPTLNINGLGAIPLNDQKGVPYAHGKLQAGIPYTFRKVGSVFLTVSSDDSNSDTLKIIGDLSTLKTTEKEDLVSSVNELFQSVDDGKTQLETTIIGKGGTISKTSSVVSFSELKTGVQSIPTVMAGQFGDGRDGDIVLDGNWVDRRPVVIPGSIGLNHANVIDGLTSTVARFNNVPYVNTSTDNPPWAFTLDMGGGFPIFRHVDNIVVTHRYLGKTGDGDANFSIKFESSDDNITWREVYSVASTSTSWQTTTLSLDSARWPTGSRYLKVSVYQGRSGSGGNCHGEIQGFMITTSGGAGFYASGGFEVIQCESFLLSAGSNIRTRPMRGLVIFSQGNVEIRGPIYCYKGLESGVPIIWPLMTNYGDVTIRGGAGGAGGGRLKDGSPGGRMFGGGFGEGGLGGSANYYASDGSWRNYSLASQNHIKMPSPDSGGGRGSYADGNYSSYAQGGAGGGGGSVGYSSYSSYTTYRGGSGGDCNGGGGGGGAGNGNGSSYYGGDGSHGGPAGGYFGVVCAGNLIVSSTISCSGGSGGYGGYTNSMDTTTTAAYPGAGGGGAGGGVITLFYRGTYTLTGSLQASGGSGGNGGHRYYDQSQGASGGNGLVGTIITKKI